MALYWAKFNRINEDLYRFDTRIYTADVQYPGEEDICIGAVIGKNPGSAKADLENGDFQPIILDGDKLLPTVKNIVLKSYVSSGLHIPSRGYIQVLNLFYLCNPNIKKAVSRISSNCVSCFCGAESNEYPWVWYVWGGESEHLNPFKARFALIKTENHFFYDKHHGRVIGSAPSRDDFAKHTQGLKHDLIVPHIQDVIKKHQKR